MATALPLGLLEKGKEEKWEEKPPKEVKAIKMDDARKWGA